MVTRKYDQSVDYGGIEHVVPIELVEGNWYYTDEHRGTKNLTSSCLCGAFYNPSCPVEIHSVCGEVEKSKYLMPIRFWDSFGGKGNETKEN
jgi:hypothetical protein